MEKPQNWMALSSIQLGGAICLPVILIGYELTKKAGLSAAMSAIILGNIVLFCLAYVTAKMAFQSKKSTAANAEYYFGPSGKYIAACFLAFSLISWFAIQTQVMSGDIQKLFIHYFGIDMPNTMVSVGLSLLMCSTAVFGVRGVSVLATLTLPMMLATLAAALYYAQATSPLSVFVDGIAKTGEGFSSKCFSLVIAASIAAVVDLPTFFRHAATKRDSMIATVLTFLVGIPAVELIGVLLGFWTEAKTLPEALTIMDHPLFAVWVSIFILCAGWTTNNTNLYSAATAMHVLCPRLTERQSALITALMCSILSAIPLLANLSQILDLMGIGVASMGGVILVAFLRKTPQAALSLFSLIAGTAAGIANMLLGSFISEVAILDAMLVAAVTMLGVSKNTIKTITEVYEV